MSDISSREYQPILSESPDSLHSTVADPTSHSENDVSGLEQRSRKRRFSTSAGETLRNHKRTPQYIPAYHELYNATVQDILNPLAVEDIKESWSDSRIELSYWTAREKEAFFIALERKGPNDSRAISRFISSKSETEVQSFILALQDGRVRESRTVDQSTLPNNSAFEVGAVCERALESAADGLAKRQLSTDKVLEQSRHGSLWLLNAETILDYNAAFDHSILGTELDSAMELLNVETMIGLSSRIFMNSKDRDGNWRTFDDDDTGPGIYCTAFLDIYNLVVGIMKRVISSAIFLATSRHKLQHTDMGRATQLVIKHRDVRAACELLGLGSVRRRLWIGIVRRCNLVVYDNPLTSNRSIPYVEVERMLIDEEDTKYAAIGSPISDNENQIDLAGIALLHDGQYQVDEAEDEQMEALDAAQDQEEEDRLWKILGEEDIHQIRIKDEPGIDIPRSSRRKFELTEDWSEKIRYRADWQLLNGPPSDENFLIKKRQRSKRAP